jgi:hypothetical protein
MSAEEIKDREEKDRFWEGCFSWCGECMHHDKLDTIGWAFVFFWGALVILAESTGFASNFRWWGDGWGVFFAGAGVIVLLETSIRLLVPEYRRGIVFGLILGFILLGIGLGGWNLILPLMLAAIGVAILSKVFSRKK